MRAVVLTLCGAIEIYAWIIFIYVLMSWLPHENGFMAKLYGWLGIVCDPFLDLFKKIIPPLRTGGAAMDFSPIVAFFALQIIEYLLRRFLL